MVEDQNPWAPRLTSRARLRKAPKRHLADPVLAVSALNATPRRLFDDRETLGHLFESLAVRDLRVYAQASRASVLHYRDSNNLEADAIVQSRDGSWIAAEIKLRLTGISGHRSSVTAETPTTRGRPAFRTA